MQKFIPQLKHVGFLFEEPVMVLLVFCFGLLANNVFDSQIAKANTRIVQIDQRLKELKMHNNPSEFKRGGKASKEEQEIIKLKAEKNSFKI